MISSIIIAVCFLVMAVALLWIASTVRKVVATVKNIEERVEPLIAKVDPFTYIVHALKSLMLKNTGLGAISFDLIYLSVFAVLTMSAATLLFRRTL